MSDFVPTEKGVPIREASTANLMLDSNDRTDPLNTSPWNFTLQKNQSILNGYFTRIGVTEVVLNWGEPNILSGINNTIDLSGGATSTIPEGFYTVANVLDRIVVDLSGSVPGLAVYNVGGRVGLTATNAFTILPGLLADQLQFGNTSLVIHLIGDNPDLRLYKYIDFTSSQLTYNQELKDATTGRADRNVLCRWYMAWDNPPTLDKYGIPILMGYTQFSCRRLFNPAKQIKWSPNQPIGQLQFEVFSDDGIYQDSYQIVDDNGNSSWYMSLQVSEV